MTQYSSKKNQRPFRTFYAHVVFMALRSHIRLITQKPLFSTLESGEVAIITRQSKWRQFAYRPIEPKADSKMQEFE
jgi:hypothetical protein